MELKPPKTLEEYQAIKRTLLELMSNPWCDQFMFMNLNKKLTETNQHINQLKNNNNV